MCFLKRWKLAKYRPRKYKNDGTPTEQEDRIARITGGKRVMGSGASDYSKGDVRDVQIGEIDFLLECKKTSKKSISIKWDWLKKISKEADEQECEPGLAFEIQGGDNDPIAERDWIAIPVRVFEKIKNDGVFIEKKCCCDPEEWENKIAHVCDKYDPNISTIEQYNSVEEAMDDDPMIGRCKNCEHDAACHGIDAIDYLRRYR